jgi:rhodanese-related sulfurtransferase
MACFITLIWGCGKDDQPRSFQLPDKIEHPKPGIIKPIEPAAFVDSLNAGVRMNIYYLQNFTPDEQTYVVNISGMRIVQISDIFTIADTLSTREPLYLICLWGDDSKRAAQRLSIKGIDTYYLDGGCYRLWKGITEHGWKLPQSSTANTNLR